MSCLDVRELLPELAIGVLPVAERTDVERHLRWCAGCRKEASELGEAAATFGFALPPSAPPPRLEDRVVARVHAVAGRTARPARRARTTAASIVAAMIAVASLGWGAAMAGRADRFEERAERAERDRRAALGQFQKVLAGFAPGFELPEDQTHLGRLTPTAEGKGGGAALQLVSPSIIDFTLVIVSGLDPEAKDRLPYRVRLIDAAGRVLRAGKITELDANGGAEVFRQFTNEDLSGFTLVQVLDAEGVVVLEGNVEGTASEL